MPECHSRISMMFNSIKLKVYFSLVYGITIYHIETNLSFLLYVNVKIMYSYNSIILFLLNL